MKIDKKLQQRIKTYTGDLTSLEIALGSYLVGQLYGWRVISLCHSPATVARSNRILGFDLQEVCPARTPLSRRVNGIRLADKLDEFWKVARGHVPGKRFVSEDDEDQPELAL